MVTIVGDPDDAELTVAAVVETVQAAEGDGFEIAVGGEASIAQESTAVIEEDLAFALLLNLPVTLLLLLFAFRALVAYPLSEIYSEMVLLMGLATGIDYSLVIITRYRGRARSRPRQGRGDHAGQWHHRHHRIVAVRR
jgi:uncharacterized membrane protein YdfJ with MMPL/SSD domain